MCIKPEDLHLLYQVLRRYTTPGKKPAFARKVSKTKAKQDDRAVFRLTSRIPRIILNPTSGSQLGTNPKPIMTAPQANVIEPRNMRGPILRVKIVAGGWHRT